MLCHVFFTVKLKFIQRRTFEGIKYTFSSKAHNSGIGTYSAFAAALGTTIGPGNITGVAVAVASGGIGAVPWMWLCGVLAMATKYAESFLALRYRDNGVGGTMVLLKKSGKNTLALVWTISCAMAGLFMGAAVPVNCLALSLPFPTWLTGGVTAFLIAFTVSFGFKGISRVCSLLVPVMSGIFLLFCLYVIFDNITQLPMAFMQMLKEGFSYSALVSGGLGAAVKHGVTRGLYSNESGLGSGGVLAAESGDNDIDHASLSAMTTVFWDTVVMCAVTGTMIAVSGGTGNEPSTLLFCAFNRYPLGRIILPLSMSLFVFATAVGWFYISKRVLMYSFKKTSVFDIIFISIAFFGAVSPPSPLWNIADAVNFVMLVPSLYIIVKMSDKITLHKR